MSEILKLDNGQISIEVEPGRGGSLRSFQFRRRNGDWIDIFQNVNTAPAGSWGYFAMLPYTARIFNGVFTWNESYFSVAPVRNSHHAIHGPGRQHAWMVNFSGPSAVGLLLDSSDHPDTFVYPSKLRMSLKYELEKGTLHIETVIENVGDAAAPIGGGSHPFIPKLLAGCNNPPVLQFNATDRFLPREDTPGEAMPSGRTQPMSGALSFENGRVPEEGWDHCLRGWSKVAYARWNDISLCLTFKDRDPDSKGFAHLWYPSGRDVWAFEQQVAIGNAFNLAPEGIDTGMRVLGPGDSTGFHHTFSVSEF